MLHMRNVCLLSRISNKMWLNAMMLRIQRILSAGARSNSNVLLVVNRIPGILCSKQSIDRLGQTITDTEGQEMHPITDIDEAIEDKKGTL